MPVKLLSEIPLYRASKGDLARAINYSMKCSKKTAWTMTRALDLNGRVYPGHMDKLYGADVFMKDSKLNEETSQKLIQQVRKDLKIPNKQKFISLMDYSKAFIEEVLKH